VKPRQRWNLCAQERTQGRQKEEDHRGQRPRSVGGRKRERVRPREVGALHDVGKRGVLGRAPKKAEALHDRRHDQKPPQRWQKGERKDEGRPHEVGENHRLAPVPAIGQNSGHRPNDEPGEDPRGHDHSYSGRAAEPGCVDGDRYHGHPVAQTRYELRQEESPEAAIGPQQGQVGGPVLTTGDMQACSFRRGLNLEHS
jgi:hypothetical protein